jgi:hypothetical protein
MIVAAFSLPLASLAQTAESDTGVLNTPPPGQGFGSQTRLWLSTQTSGVSSVTDERPMPGEVATLVYRRYLNSFTHPIPERYESDSFKTTGSGATGGTSGGGTTP